MGKVDDWLRRTNRLGMKPATNMVQVRHAIMEYIVDQGPKTKAEILKHFQGSFGEDALARGINFLRDDGYIHRETTRMPWRLGKPRLSGIISSNEIQGVISNLTV